MVDKTNENREKNIENGYN